MADEALQYRLLRFFDFDVQPGKRYRYRVRLVLKNPNANEPEQYLSDEVLAKRNDVKQQYALRIAEGVDVEQAKAIARRQWGTIQSAWSEPTNAISVPRDSRLLAGPVQPARDAASEPSGKVTVVTWVKDQGTEVFDEHPVRLGEVINFTSKMTSPLTPSESSDVDHVTDTVVLDLHGGDRLFDDSRLCRPGAILLMDPDGTLTVRQELDDQTERIALRDQAETDVDQPTIQPTGNRRGSPMGAAGHDNLGVLRGGH
jgi:hypothetical protein